MDAPRRDIFKYKSIRSPYSPECVYLSYAAKDYRPLLPSLFGATSGRGAAPDRHVRYVLPCVCSTAASSAIS